MVRRIPLLLSFGLCAGLLSGPETGTAAMRTPEIEEAENLSFLPAETGVRVEIEPPGGTGGPLTYWLVPKPVAAMVPPPGTTVVPVPAERIVSLSTTYLGSLAALGELDRVVGIDDATLATDPALRDRLASGDLVETGSPESLDLESVLAAKPDLVLLTRIGPGRPGLESRLAQAGIPVLVTSAWRENNPLGRAEWIKLFGLLTGREERAENLFAGISERYRALAERVRRADPARPKVLLSAPYGGTWYLPGGRSYSARFISDAGGDYLWSGNTDTGSFPLDFEAVLSEGLKADFWINPSRYRSLAEIRSADERFAVLPAFRSGRVYNRTRSTEAGRGNAFWESGAVYPDEVLADLIGILHPALLPEREFRYYERLPR